MSIHFATKTLRGLRQNNSPNIFVVTIKKIQMSGVERKIDERDKDQTWGKEGKGGEGGL